MDKVAKAVGRALAGADVRERLAVLGNEPTDMMPAQFEKFVRREMTKYARIIEAAGIQPQ